jgi:hypothetical protein
MRNIFDQYDAPENRLTHALGCCLHRDHHLLHAFIRWATGKREGPAGPIEVLEQQIPGTPVEDVDENEPTGLPDLWLHDQGQWSLLVESKVMARVSSGQLRRHLNTARRNGLTEVTLAVIAPSVPTHRLEGVVYRTWRDLYCWLRHQARESDWAACMAEYMEVAEARMTAESYLDGQSLTQFTGVPFDADHPYTYLRAKQVLGQAMMELRNRRDLRALGMDPDGEGRPAITGKGDVAVWDFLPLREAKGKSSFTACPHLTLSIQAHRTEVGVTLPNAASARMRRNLVALGIEGFARLVGEVEAGVSKAIRPIKGAYPTMGIVQRHYASQRSHPVVDARLEFDLRTAVDSGRSLVKPQGQWMEAAYRALEDKRSNLQMGVGAVFPYSDSHMQSRGILDVVAGVWIGCKPWLRTILEGA